MVLLPGMSSYAADLAPADRRGEYMGFYTMAFGVAFAIGPWLGTETLDRLGPGALWTATFGLGIVSAAAMWRLPALRPQVPAR
jgi:MFS family permease